MNFKKAMLSILVTAFAASSWGCGVIELETTMGLVTDGETPSEINVNVVGFTGSTSLEGYIVMGMAIDLDIISVIFGSDLLAILSVDDLLFYGTPMMFVGNDTQAICTIVDDATPGGGDALINLKAGTIDFNMILAVKMLVENPDLANLLPDGFPVSIDMSAQTDMTLIEMIGMLLGTGSGFTISQEIDLPLSVPIRTPGGAIVYLDGVATGNLSLTSVPEPPVTPGLTHCANLVGGA
ncbi:MAG: hypothetical protein JRG96_04895 [Deltaproteobacteria bacterium]|nr:hypothetical protein [Deltaproteobacteria bacterium]MBW2421003.1 hypothetical protein [Deltaproteobacteria bacterium]